MNKNIILCIAGIAVGSLVGWFAADSISKESPSNRPARPSQMASRADGSQTGAAADGQLPPGHPEIGAETAGGSAASTSATAQAAMERADRAPTDFAAQREAGQTFYQLKDYDKAELYLTRALDLSPTDFDALTAMGNTRYDRGDYAGAATFYERALAVKPKDANVRADYGRTFALRQPPDL